MAELDDILLKPARVRNPRTKEDWAQEMLKHEAKFPGCYRPEERCDSAHNEAFRQWSKKKIQLREAYEVTTKIDAPVFKYAQTVLVERDLKRRSDRLTASDYLNKFRDKIKILNSMSVDNPEWPRIRECAYNLRRKYFERCAADKITPRTDVPEVPIPSDLRGKK